MTQDDDLDAPHTCAKSCEGRAYQLEIRRLQFENMDLRKDAERYRWLLDQGYTHSNGFFALEFYAGLDDFYENKSFNEAIDEAMKDG